MTLEIIWWNPASPSVNERRVEQIAADDFGSVYAVRSADETTVFEVILRNAALVFRFLNKLQKSGRERFHGD
jgi:hypothetical protein